MKERKKINLVTVVIEFKDKKREIIEKVVCKGNSKQELIKNLNPYRLFEKGKLKEFKVIDIKVTSTHGLTNYKE